jgi:hypothetical protein
VADPPPPVQARDESAAGMTVAPPPDAADPDRERAAVASSAALRPAGRPDAWSAGTSLRPLAAGPPTAPGGRRAWAPGLGPAEPSGPGQESVTVQVTIGRVEVRAAPADGRAAMERPASARGPAPSLADYLRQRSGSTGARP